MSNNMNNSEIPNLDGYGRPLPSSPTAEQRMRQETNRKNAMQTKKKNEENIAHRLEKLKQVTWNSRGAERQGQGRGGNNGGNEWLVAGRGGRGGKGGRGAIGRSNGEDQNEIEKQKNQPKKVGKIMNQVLNGEEEGIETDEVVK